MHKQQRTKLPSDSNYFSESHSDVDNVPAHPDVCDSSNLEASDHARAPAFSPKPAKGGKKISNMSEEKLETDLREHSEMGRTLSYGGTPDAVSSISNSQRWSQAEENSNVSRFVHNLKPCQNHYPIFVAVKKGVRIGKGVLEVLLQTTCFILYQKPHGVNRFPCSQTLHSVGTGRFSCLLSAQLVSLTMGWTYRYCN